MTRWSRPTLFALALLAGCAHVSTAGLGETIYIAEQVLPLDDGPSNATALGIRNEQILAVGTEKEVRAQMPAAKLERLGPGTFILPGLNDAHLHLTLALTFPAPEKLPAEPTARLAALTRLTHKEPRWFFFQLDREGRPLTAAEWASAVGPARVMLYGGPLTQLSPAALAEAELAETYPDGTVPDRELPGVSARIAKLPAFRQQLLAHVRSFLAQARTLGLTSAQVMTDDLEDVLAPLADSGELTCRLRFVPAGFQPGGALKVGTASESSRPLMLRTEGRKFYEDSTQYIDADTLRVLFSRAEETGVHLVLHVLEEKPLQTVLDAVEANPEVAPWIRLEHVDVATPAQLDELASLKLTVCSNASLIPEWDDTHAFPLADFAAHHIQLCLGSDWIDTAAPERPLSPWKALELATNHGAQSLTTLQALQAMTRGAAHAEGLGTHKGELRPGMLADFIVVDRNPLRTPTRELAQTRVRRTFVNGLQVFPERTTSTAETTGKRAE